MSYFKVTKTNASTNLYISIGSNMNFADPVSITSPICVFVNGYPYFNSGTICVPNLGVGTHDIVITGTNGWTTAHATSNVLLTNTSINIREGY